MLCTCFSTVPSVTQSCRAIPAFERPSAISSSTSSSRGEKLLERVVDAPGGDELLDKRGVDDRCALDDSLDRDEKVIHVCHPALQEVPDPLTAAEEIHCVLYLDVCGKNEDRRLRGLIANHPRRPEPLSRVGRRHPNVDDHQLGVVLTDELGEIGRVPGLADDLVASTLEQARQPLAEKDVVVGQSHAGGAGGHDAHYRLPCARGDVQLGRRVATLGQAMAHPTVRDRVDFERLAEEQEALRRVATLVARGASPATVFEAVAAEVATILGSDFSLVGRYEADATLTHVASHPLEPLVSTRPADRTRWR